MLHNAAFDGNADSVELLLAHGANVHAEDNNKTTPLHSASSQEVAKVLLNNGANIHAINNNGNTPFHAAVYSANSLDNDNNDKFPIYIKLVEFLIGYLSNIPNELIIALKYMGIDIKSEINPLLDANSTNGTNIINTSQDEKTLWEQITGYIKTQEQKEQVKQDIINILFDPNYNSLLHDVLGVYVNIDTNENTELLAKLCDYEA